MSKINPKFSEKRHTNRVQGDGGGGGGSITYARILLLLALYESCTRKKIISMSDRV